MADFPVGSRVVYSVPTDNGGGYSYYTGEVYYVEDGVVDVDADYGMIESDVDVNQVGPTPRTYQMIKRQVRGEDGNTKTVTTYKHVLEGNVPKDELVVPFRSVSGDWIYPIIEIPKEWILMPIDYDNNPFADILGRLWGSLRIYQFTDPGSIRFLDNFVVVDGEGKATIYKKITDVPPNLQKSATKIKYYFGSANEAYPTFKVTFPNGRTKVYEYNTDIPEDIGWDRVEIVWNTSKEKAFWTKSEQYKFNPETEFWFTETSEEIPKVGDFIVGIPYNHPKGTKLVIWTVTNETLPLMIYNLTDFQAPSLNETLVVQALLSERTQENYYALTCAVHAVQRARHMIQTIYLDPETSDEAKLALKNMFGVISYPSLQLIEPPPPPEPVVQAAPSQDTSFRPAQRRSAKPPPTRGRRNYNAR